jgi:hypothetical protein
MIPKFALPLLLCFSLNGLSFADDPAPVAKPIFNGKDLTGWKSDAKGTFAHWTVSDGILHAVSDPKKQGNQLWTTKEYTDFSLTLEFKFIGGKIDSGVMLRSLHQGRDMQIDFRNINLLKHN